MHILISAYACEPGKGSEPEVGLQIVLAAASEHEVWVITRDNNLKALDDILANHPLRSQIHLVGLEVEGLAKRLKNRGGLLGLHWYYDAWQRRLAKVAVDLDRKIRFDVVHHATFGTYWTRVGVAAIDKPLVWGPVGGGVKPPLGLIRVMGLRGAIGDFARVLTRPVIAYLTGSRHIAKQAAVVLVQNPETASATTRSDNVRIVPHGLVSAGAVELVDLPRRGGRQDGPLSLVVAGRLVGWKGVLLALMALRSTQDSSIELNIYGEGPDRRRLTRWVHANGFDNRVVFHGRVPRKELVHAIFHAAVVVHPALHDESPLIVAEALALGTPVVSLDRGGPPILRGYWPEVPSRSVVPTTPRPTARALAIAIEDLIGLRGPVDLEPANFFRKALMRAYADAASDKTS